MDADGTPRSSFGGGRLGTTHYMSRRVLVDSIAYLTKEYKVDGFRFDMMGDHDAESIEQAYNTARALNPNLIMLGEGWVTYAGDENSPVQPADQSWMKDTDTVAVFQMIFEIPSNQVIQTREHRPSSQVENVILIRFLIISRHSQLTLRLIHQEMLSSILLLMII